MRLSIRGVVPCRCWPAAWACCWLLAAVALGAGGEIRAEAVKSPAKPAPAKNVSAKATPAKKAKLVGSRANVKLRSGKTLRGVTVEELSPGRKPGSVSKLRIFNPATRSRMSLRAAAIEEVSAPDGRLWLIFDDVAKVLAPPLAEPGEAGVRLWPELSDDEQTAAIQKGKKFLEKVAARFSTRKMRLYETRYFLFLSAVPPPLAATCQTQLDAMHEQLCRAYGVEKPDKLWLGKAVVVAFDRPEDFMQFEKTFFRVSPPPGSPRGGQPIAQRRGRDRLLLRQRSRLLCPRAGA